MKRSAVAVACDSDNRGDNVLSLDELGESSFICAQPALRALLLVRSCGGVAPAHQRNVSARGGGGGGGERDNGGKT